MSPQRIKVHQIHKAQPFKVLLTDINRLLHTMNRTGGMQTFGNSFSAENVMNLPNADHIISRICKCIQCSCS